MRFRLESGRLANTTNQGRTRQFRLPSRKVVMWSLLAAALLYCWWNPVAPALAIRAIVERSPAKMGEAATEVWRDVASDVENTFAVRRPSPVSQLTTIRLTVPNNTLADMQRSLRNGDPELNHDPGGHKPYFKVLVQLEDEPVQPAKICLRGSMHWHHRPEKPSFRIKLKKEHPRAGDRYIELTTLEDSLGVINWLPMQLAPTVGLMHDDSRHVRVFINNKYFGVYVTTSRAGEVYALSNQRMPGTFFKGDFAERLWDDVAAWKQFGEKHPDDARVFADWLDLLQRSPDVEVLQELEKIFDTEVFARWAALMTVVGSIHTDERHNHTYFFCSNQGKLHAMPWDCNGYGLHTEPDSPVDVQIQPVLRLLSLDPRWVHRRNHWIHQLITEEASLRSVQQKLDDLMDAAGPDLRADRNLGNLRKYEGTGWTWRPVSVARLDSERRRTEHWVRQRNEFLSYHVGTARVAVRPHATRDGWSQVAVFGHAAVNATVTKHDGSTSEHILYPGLSSLQIVHESHQQQAPIQMSYLFPAVLTYDLSGSPQSIHFANALTGEPVTAEVWGSAIDQIAHGQTRSIHPEEFDPLPDGPLELGPGRIELREDLIVSANQTLVIHPGTQLDLAPGVGIYCRGQTIARGTESMPIVIRGLDVTRPWAAIGICGAATAGSRFEFVTVSGGSTGRLDQLRFKGMFNVYDCPDVALRHCHFGINHDGDDAVNLAESVIRVEDCHWMDARADGLDVDMCHGEIRHCTWTNSGNDGLDLMASKVHVSQCTMTGSGDKGISVGENSRLLAEEIRIRDCHTGIEIKDDSVAEMTSCSIESCETAVRAYQKKWFYAEGGRAALIDCQLTDNKKQVDVQKRSRLWLVRTPVSGTSQHKRVRSRDDMPRNWISPFQTQPVTGSNSVEFQVH
ncbi:MAG: CotH kinase family protein [Pirellulaceae bacterium]